MIMKYFIIILVIALTACQPENAEEAGHGHAHGTDGGHDHETESTLTVDTTLWTDKTELFVEFPALVVGQISQFAAHFTKLNGHKPVKEGNVTISLIKGKKGVRSSVDAPTSPGIFTPGIKPKDAGKHKLVFNIRSPGLTDRIVIDDLSVYQSVAEAEKEIKSGEEDGGKISFLKEQAWKFDFQTARVVKGEIYDVIRTSGIWTLSPENKKVITATVSGIVGFAAENLTKGTPVKTGQLLMTISSEELTSNNLESQIEKARANYEQAKSAYQRKKQLFEKEIVSKSEFEQAENDYRVAKSSYETLKAGYSAGGKQIRAPFSGYIKTIATSNGDYTEEGTVLVSIGGRNSRMLKANASVDYSHALQSIHNIFYQPVKDKWSDLRSTGGHLLSVGKSVKPDNPMVPIYAMVNEPVHMPDGGFTEVQIATGEPQQKIIVPESALLEDYGTYSVMIQLSGELFERRIVKTGRQNGKMVEITDGLKPGEMIVTTGAYQVKMASMSAQGAGHGHVH
jgi:RND family efflux transporter MFP subunit